MCDSSCDIIVGRKYWYKWSSNVAAECGEVVGVRGNSVLFKSPVWFDNHARVVERSDVHCVAVRRWWSW